MKAPFRSVAGALLMAWHGVASAACVADVGPERHTLLELFTSEGCSSCPPADRWLSALRGRDIRTTRLVPLAFHVDYWDDLGWADRYAQPAYSARQRWLAGTHRAGRVYTPQFVLNGKDWRPDWQGGLPSVLTGQGPTLHLTLEQAGNAQLQLDGRVESSRGGVDAQVYLALYENNLGTRIAAGENAGRWLNHDYVVRKLYGPMRIPAEGRLAFRQVIPIDADWKIHDIGVVAFVQDGSTGEVTQALQRPFCRS